MIQPRPFSLQRAAMMTLMLLSWFALSNHCVLAAALPEAVEAVALPACPMHASATPNAPKKQDSGSETAPCCKIIRALVSAKAGSPANTLEFVLREYFTGASPALAPPPAHNFVALDTGPPEVRSFSESVLQRSILAHAPPVRTW